MHTVGLMTTQGSGALSEEPGCPDTRQQARSDALGLSETPYWAKFGMGSAAIWRMSIYNYSITNDGAALPLVSVVIPHCNSLATLKNCVSLLDRQTFCRDRFEIIVADNNSSCGMDAVREAVPAARVIHADEQGAGPARNAGVGASKGSILAFIDSDCLPNLDWIEKGIAGIQAYDFIGGRVIVTSEDPLRPNPIEAFEMVFAFNFKRYINRVGFTGTGNMFVWRKVFDAVGPFRNGVPEDVDWSFRARAQSFRLGYVKDLIVEHPARKTWSELIARWKRLVLQQYLLYQERPFFIVNWLLHKSLMPLSILPHACHILMSSRLINFGSRWGALKVLARLRLWRTWEMFSLLVRNSP
jgi:glycosyltransferase involved in cell wall biosynthesis